jgi:hypothetical protein
MLPHWAWLGVTWSPTAGMLQKSCKGLQQIVGSLHGDCARKTFFPLSMCEAQPAHTHVQQCYVCCRNGCCRLLNGKAAEGELRGLAAATNGSHTQHDLIRHNLVVFKGGEGALQVGCGGPSCWQVR